MYGAAPYADAPYAADSLEAGVVALSGVAVAVSAGALAPSGAPALSGAQIATAAGAASSESVVPLSGAGVQALAGTLGVGAGEAALTGTAVLVSLGTLAPASAIVLAGSAVDVSAGAIYTPGRLLAGDAAAFSAGQLLPFITRPVRPAWRSAAPTLASPAPDELARSPETKSLSRPTYAARRAPAVSTGRRPS